MPTRCPPPVLVHGVHVAQPRDDEVDDGAPRRDDPVVLARVVDLLRCVLRLRQPLVDGLGGDLGLGQRVDEVLVVQDVTCVVPLPWSMLLYREQCFCGPSYRPGWCLFASIPRTTHRAGRQDRSPLGVRLPDALASM